jgi:anti-sigma B factor antagonist
MSVSTSNTGDKPAQCPVCGTSVHDTVCPSCGHLLWFASRQVGDVTVIHLIDSRAAVMELLDLLDNSVIDGMIGRLVINFGSIQQVSSAALGKLVKLMHRADSVRGKLALCGLHADLRQVFKITKLDQVFAIFENENDALKSYDVEVGI